MYASEIGVPAEVHDTFVKNHPLCNLLQSSSWAKVKGNWGSEIVGVYEKGTLVTSSLVLIKPLPAGFTMLYTPRDPVMDYTNERLVSYFMAELKKFNKKKWTLLIRMDPTVRYQDFHLGGRHQPHAEATTIIETLKKAGVKYQGLTMGMGATIQPHFQADIYREDFSGERLSKNAKKMIRTTEKEGVVVQQGHIDFVDELRRVIQSTVERQHIFLRNSDYFKKLLNAYPEDSFIMLAWVNLKERLDSTRQRYDKNQKSLSNLKEDQVRKRHNLEGLDVSLTRELKELEENITEAGEIVMVADALTVTFGPTSEILYTGLDDHYKHYMPTYVTWRDAIQECFNHDCEGYDIGDLEGSLNDDLIKFKVNFDPTISKFIGEFDLPANKLLFKASEYAYKLRKQRK